MESFRERRRILDSESIYDLIDEVTLSEELYQTKLEELECAEYIESFTDMDGEILYKARDGICWSKIYMLDDPIKKGILFQLIENPKTFFVLYNTQKGKLRIAGKEMFEWSVNPLKRVVTFLIVDNDRTLSTQSSEGIKHCFPEKEEHFLDSMPQDESGNHKVRVFELSSNSKISYNDIETYIDAYASPYSEKNMPVITVLANNKQIEKFIRLLHYICSHKSPSLTAGVIWDEADRTYPLFRDKKFIINNKELSYLSFIQDEENKAIYRTGFVTATDGDLLEETYPECANAHHYKQPQSDPNYRAIHHSDSIIKYITLTAKESNNSIAKRLITTNWERHFNKPIHMRDGSTYYRKTIINSNSKVEDMKELAKYIVGLGAYCIVFSQFGLQIFKPNKSVEKMNTRHKYFNKVLFASYKLYELHDKPLFIIGRKKVDRGLGFHYAPRHNSKLVKEIYAVKTDGVEGLIWTDLILGNKIEDLATAVQKVGRGAGIIAQCPQYCGNFTYWIVEETSHKVIDHNRVVDAANIQCGENTILQAKTRAEATIPKRPRKVHDVDPSLFRVIKADTPEETLEIAKDIITNIFGKRFRMPEKDKKEEHIVFYKTSLNTKSEVVDHISAVKKVPGATGGGKGENEINYKRILPCYSDTTDNTTLHCVIPLIDPSYTTAQKKELDSKYQEYIYEIPQEEDE